MNNHTYLSNTREPFDFPQPASWGWQGVPMGLLLFYWYTGAIHAILVQCAEHVSVCLQLQPWASAGASPSAGPCNCLAPPFLPRDRSWAIHTIQRVQCTVGVRVTVLVLHEQLPCLLHRRSRPSAPPCLPRLGVGGPLPVFCRSCLVWAAAVLTTVQPLLGSFSW